MEAVARGAMDAVFHESLDSEQKVRDLGAWVGSTVGVVSASEIALE